MEGLAQANPRSFSLRRFSPSKSSLPTAAANRGSRRNCAWSLRSSYPSAKPKSRCLTSSSTLCSTCSCWRKSEKHPASIRLMPSPPSTCLNRRPPPSLLIRPPLKSPTTFLFPRSKRHHQSGSRPKGRNLRVLSGRPGMGRLRFPSLTCQPSTNTSLVSGSIIGLNHFRRNTGRSWSATAWRSMNVMCGIDGTDWIALSGLCFIPIVYPGRCPGLVWICPFGAQKRVTA